MDIYKLKFTTLQNEIFRLLCIKVGTSLNQRQISDFLKVSPTAVAKALPLLEKEGLVKIDKSKRMNLNSVMLNRDNQKAMQFKRMENLKMIHESGLLEFLEDNFPGGTVVLFGSYSRGDDTLQSDIDIAVIDSKQKNINLDAFEKTFERKIVINSYQSLAKIHKRLRESICNGIVLAGGIEL